MSDDLRRTKPGDVHRDPITGTDYVVIEAECANEGLLRVFYARIDAGLGRGFSSKAIETNALYGGGKRRGPLPAHF